MVNWTKEDKSLGSGKGWAEGRVDGYYYLQSSECALPITGVGITGFDGTRHQMAGGINIETLCLQKSEYRDRILLPLL